MKSMILVLGISIFAISITAFADGYDDAEILALQVSGELLPPPLLYERISKELEVIHQFYPGMERIHVFPPWAPGELIVGLTDDALEEFMNGEYHGLDSLNTLYGPVEMELILFNYILLEFSLNYNPECLSPIYSAAEGVLSAQPNHTIGDGDDINATIMDSSFSVYTFRRGWGDCPSGCMEEHLWKFYVTESTVTFMQHEGNPILEVDFSADTTMGIAPLTVQFVDMSLIGMFGETSWSWDFDNDDVEDSNEQHPVYTYTTPGSYTVKLTITCGEVSHTKIKEDYIIVQSEGSPGRSDGQILYEYSLYQNYPNPFNPITEIKYALPKECWVRLEVYDILGQRVISLVKGWQEAGYKSVRWDAGSLSSGIYFYRLQAGDFVETRKMVLIR